MAPREAGVSFVMRRAHGEKPVAKRRGPNVWIVAGALCIVAALGLVGYNLYDQSRAGEDSLRALEMLAADGASVVDGLDGEGAFGADAADPSQGDSVAPLGALGGGQAVIDPETPMPTVEADGRIYIGTLRIPALGVELPVQGDWSDPALRVSPCRYYGSAYADNLVIAAHNYATHFGGLRSLDYGSEVSFTDVRGNLFLYEVASIETLGATAIPEMTESEWDLTLFTCTLSGAERVTVRCSRVPL